MSFIVYNVVTRALDLVDLPYDLTERVIAGGFSELKLISTDTTTRTNSTLQP